MITNPFVALVERPVATLTLVAYGLILLSVTAALVGELLENAEELYLAYTHRYAGNKFGPQWDPFPPGTLFLQVAWFLFLAAVEAMLLGGLAYIAT